MKIVVECYGASRRWCGDDVIELELETGRTADDALDLLAGRFPDFAARREGIAVAVGNEITSPRRPLEDGDVVALIPPVSAG